MRKETSKRELLAEFFRIAEIVPQNQQLREVIIKKKNESMYFVQSFSDLALPPPHSHESLSCVCLYVLMNDYYVTVIV